jgi:hypothetical protein
MACPYFDPGERLPGPGGALGDLYSGRCRLGDSSPDAQTCFDCCNMGYARGRCSRFPLNDGPDAVRFCVSKDGPEAIRILYSIERDHHPFSNGALEFRTATGAFTAAPEALSSLGAAYVRSYLRRTR